MTCRTLKGAAELMGCLSLRDERLTGTPNEGVALADGGAREHRIGQRLTSAVRGDLGFEVSLNATYREAANPGSGSGEAPTNTA